MENGPEWLGFLSEFQFGLLVATGIGLIVGLEREFDNQSEKTDFAGIRTFPLVAILGYILGFLMEGEWIWVLPAALIGFGGFLTMAYYIQAKNGKYGITSEMALMVVFISGALVAHGDPLNALAVAVIVTVLLSVKAQMRWFITQITQEEIHAFVKFIVLALLLLPLLPDESFGPEELLNYRSIGWVVVLVSSIGFAGYLLLKFVGSKRGILLTALVGGLFSSTMIAWVFAARSRETPALSPVYAAGIILSCCIMFGRVVLISSIFSPGVGLVLLVPCGMMLVASLVAAWLIMRSAGKKTQADAAVEPGNPLDIMNALVFAGIYIAVTFLMYYSRQWFGNSGAYITGALSGIADSDAITISTAKWGTTPERYKEAANIIVIAILSNTIFKATVALVRGDKTLVRPLLLGFGGMLGAGLLWLLTWGLW